MPQIGETVCWQTMFGQWFFGVLLSIREDMATVRRTAPAGAICEVQLTKLS